MVIPGVETHTSNGNDGPYSMILLHFSLVGDIFRHYDCTSKEKTGIVLND
jgi:hypothetical protein